jgi:cell wall-associated NlpC family hydrolase
MITQNKLCKKYVGIPFEHRGRTANGIDCWGLIILAYRDIGINILDLENYEYEWEKNGKNLFLQNYYENWEKVDDLKDIRFMDLLMLKNKSEIPCHAGLYLSDGRFLQCANKVGVVNCVLNDNWKNKIYGIYRYVSNKDKKI